MAPKDATYESNVDFGSDLDMSRKVALVTGITGQDGSYLTELLLEKGYEVSLSYVVRF